MSEPRSHTRTAHDAMVKWMVPDRVIYTWASGEISPSVREWMNTQVVYLYHSCRTPKVHLFIDYRQVTHQSPATRQDRPAVWHPRRGWCITVGAVSNPVLRTILNPVLRLFRTSIQDFSSEEAALAFLQKVDPSLPDLKPYLEAIKRQR